MSSLQERINRLNCERSRRVGIAHFGVGVAVEVPLAGETAPKRKKMARVSTSLSEREASGAGLLLGDWD
jgi:hypothetical protein